MQKVLIIGSSSYLSQGMCDSDIVFDKINRPFSASEAKKYGDYDYVVNFCIQKEHFERILNEEEMIDVSVVKEILKYSDKTKFIYLSSRKVYGSTTDLITYKEEDELKPFDIYSQNKYLIEQKIKELINENLIILRISNIIDCLPHKKDYKTFIGWIELQLKTQGKVICDIEKDTKKDFITRDYFQQAVKSLIKSHIKNGTYNVGASFALSIEEILNTIMMKNPDKLLYSEKLKESEQFILDCSKIQKYAGFFNKADLLKKCEILSEELARG